MFKAEKFSSNASKINDHLNESPYKRTDYLLKRSMRLQSGKQPMGCLKRKQFNNLVGSKALDPRTSYNG